MKANEFVKGFGWGEATRFVGWYGGNTSFKFLKAKEQTVSVHSGDQPYDFHIDDLKRLVESYELVEIHGGLIESKIYVGCCNDADLSKAIADVESCQ